jgi:two-component system, OmpR family, response regulator
VDAMQEMKRIPICVVEDDPKLAELLCNQLLRFGFEPYQVTNFRNIDQEVVASQAKLVILDINLPYYDGFYWCRKIRQLSNAPILYLSARAGEMDQVLALESGGDDYITKPFHPEVLMAKIRAMLRRAYGEYASGTPASDTLSWGDLRLDVRRGLLHARDVTVSLTATEMELLRQLIEAGGNIVRREDLLIALWDDTHFVDDNTLTVNVARVRRKLAEVGFPDVIVTVRGLGYRLDDTGSVGKEDASS